MQPDLAFVQRSGLDYIARSPWGGPDHGLGYDSTRISANDAGDTVWLP